MTNVPEAVDAMKSSLNRIAAIERLIEKWGKESDRLKKQEAELLADNSGELAVRCHIKHSTIAAIVDDLKALIAPEKELLIVRAIFDGRNYHTTIHFPSQPTYAGHFSSLKKIRKHCDEVEKLGEYKKDYVIEYVR